MTSVRMRGTAAARSARPAGVSTFGGASTSARAAFVQRPTSAARSATGRSSSPAPQSTKRSTPRGRSPLRPRGVVAAEDGAFGQRAHLLVDGKGSDGSSAHATVPPPRHARTARAAAVRSPSASGACATTASGVPSRYTIATGSASASARSGAPSSAARRPAGGDQIGPDRVRGVGRHLDLHRKIVTLKEAL